MAEATTRPSDRRGRAGSDEFLAPLAAVGTADRALVGGKAANLGELLRTGYRVPDGFVVTTTAYAHAVAVRRGGNALDVPDGVRGGIASAYQALGAGPVAVRSSATAEDLPGAAFAGQQETVLNAVGTEAVVDAVRRCWESLWADRAVAYRRRHGIPDDGLGVGVVVQSMVEAEVAGVLFTANPATGARDEVVINASPGLGEAVAAGLVTPDQYVLEPTGRVRSWSAGAREVVVRSRPGGGVVRAEGDAGAPTRLPNAILAELARVGIGIAEHFGRPQDIEWAYAEGHLWVLQSRPITALPPPPLGLSAIQRLTGPQLIEMLPARPFPLDVSAWIVPGLGRMVARLADEIVGLRVDFADMLPERDGVVERFVPPAPRPTLRLLTAPIRNLRRVGRYDPTTWTADPRYRVFQRRVARLADREPRGLDWAELRGRPRQVLDTLDVMTDLRVDYLPRAGVDLLRLRLVLGILGRTAAFTKLIAGAPTRTADANHALEALARRVRSDPVLWELFGTLDAERLWDEIWRRGELARFRAAVEDVLAEYGHRETTSPLLVSAPTWQEAPEVVLGAVQALRDQQPPRPPGRTPGEEALQRVLAHPVLRRGRGRLRAWVGRAVERARIGVALREDTHFYGTQTRPLLRSSLLEMGCRLAEAGVLAGCEEVFHLRLGELERLAEPGSMPDGEAARIRRVASRRAARRAELAGVPLISPAVLFPTRASDGAAIVSGIAGGGGRAIGPVRVIADPSEFGRLRTGDVLVCPYTNPSWTPLFQRAAAVVVDTGGPVSHAAIVAREYGVPAVMGTGRATATLVDGQVVTVDGDRGQVLAATDGGGRRPR